MRELLNKSRFCSFLSSRSKIKNVTNNISNINFVNSLQLLGSSAKRSISYKLRRELTKNGLWLLTAEKLHHFPHDLLLVKV